jgi:hypothetical protein
MFFSKSKKNEFYTAMGGLPVCLLVSGGLFVFHTAKVMTYLQLWAALVVALALHETFNNWLSLQFVILAFITNYQFYFAIEHLHVEWWVESVMVVLVGFLYLFDSLLFYYNTRSSEQSDFKEMGQDDGFRNWYGRLVSFLLFALSLVPLHGVGLFKIKTPLMAAAFVSIWITLAFTEERKRQVCKGFALPMAAFKCAPLLYLHRYYWIFAQLFVCINVVLLKRNSVR